MSKSHKYVPKKDRVPEIGPIKSYLVTFETTYHQRRYTEKLTVKVGNLSDWWDNLFVEYDEQGRPTITHVLLFAIEV